MSFIYNHPSAHPPQLLMQILGYKSIPLEFKTDLIMLHAKRTIPSAAAIFCFNGQCACMHRLHYHTLLVPLTKSVEQEEPYLSSSLQCEYEKLWESG